jgi:hypothetical protein
MCAVFMELMVSMGLVGSVMGNYPEEVQANWTERMEKYTEWANNQVEEVQQFGQAYDEED